MGYCERNPVQNIEKSIEAPGVCGILTPSQLEALLRAADDEMIPMITVQAFAGLRPSEAQRLTFENLRFMQKDVAVDYQKNRATLPRYVDMEPNLVEWLAPFKDKTGPIRPKSYREKWDILRTEVGLFDSWPHDALRHSYGSYHYAKYRKLELVASLMGHTNTHTTRRHYLKRIDDPSHSDAYWEIRPNRLIKGPDEH